MACRRVSPNARAARGYFRDLPYKMTDCSQSCVTSWRLTIRVALNKRYRRILFYRAPPLRMLCGAIDALCMRIPGAHRSRRTRRERLADAQHNGQTDDGVRFG